MNKRVIWLLGIAIACPLFSVPLRLISPKEVNSTTGFIITSTGTYLLSDDVYVNSGVTYAIQISNSNVTLDLNGKTLGSDKFGIRIPTGVGNITVRNGTINGCSYGVAIESNSSDIYIENIKLMNQRSVGIESIANPRLYIRRCTFSVYIGGTALILTSASDSEISDTIFVQAPSGIGINISSSSGVRFKNIQVASNSVGFLVNSSNNLLIEDSSFYRNTNSISLNTTSSSIFSSCVFYGNGSDGITINGDCGGNVVRNCLAYSNGGNGFRNNSASTNLLGNLAFNHQFGNYAGNGVFSYIQVNNGTQLLPGSVVDPRVDNISIG
jgi:hypothetical protein